MTANGRKQGSGFELNGRASFEPSASGSAFEYDRAFARNRGWVTREEQQSLKCKRVAIAGMGGVGGAHLLTLARLGIGGFRISDFDRFELANFNRQIGATVSNLEAEKLDVMRRMALEVNPELDVGCFGRGIDADNVGEFLDGADLYLDGIDFFALEARRLIFAECARLRIPAITAAPLGMGVALLLFLPGKMSFEKYFCLDGYPREEQLLRFLIGLAPRMLHSSYLVDPSAVDLVSEKGPSTAMAVDLCAGLAVSHVLKVLLQRGPVPAVPRSVCFDAYKNRLVKTWRPGGNRNPLQRLLLAVVRRRLRM